MKKLLAGIKVVELGTHVAVPQTGRIMADWGAEVIKVEPPHGEPWRTIGNSYGVPFAADNNPIFQTPNMNKKGIAIDLKTSEGKEVMMKLLETADVFITNTRPKALAKLGMDYETLRQKFPQIIFAHFSSYGPKGPEKNRPGFDIAAFWARGGMPLEWTTQGNTIFKPEAGFADATCASLLVSGILAAIINRSKTGKGEMLQSSLYSAALWYNSIGVMKGQAQYGHVYPRTVEKFSNLTNPPYQTKDGDWIYISITNWTTQGAGVLKLLKMENYIMDPRFESFATIRSNMVEIVELVKAAFANVSTKEVLDGFSELDLVAEKVANPNELTLDEQAWANQYLGKIMLENGSEVILPTNPIQFLNAGPSEMKLGPQIGGDSVEILKSLGYTTHEIDNMLENKSIVGK